jgi:hypothetical protein
MKNALLIVIAFVLGGAAVWYFTGSNRTFSGARPQAGGPPGASRPGGGPAEAIDRWLERELGPAAHPLPAGPTAGELAALDALSGRIARQRGVKEARAGEPGP